jgi:hypothetical protein
MVELVTGLTHDELETKATLPHCMALHQRLSTLGIRWLPAYEMDFDQIEVSVNCEDLVEDIRCLGRRGSPVMLEQILTRARLPVIRKFVKPKTLIYTHYLEGIERPLRQALEKDGWRVGSFTGEDKSGLDAFISGDLDVLLGSSAISTGVDGLQQVCSRLIFNVLPWTHAEYEQIKGRIYRQGQRQGRVTMVLPLTFAEVNGERWSWCEAKMSRLRFKKSIADAAVDGVVPEGQIRTPAQAYQDLLAWLERLATGHVQEVTRSPIRVPLPDTDLADVRRRQRRYGEFSVMNQRWNRATSEVTHQRLQQNPEEWAQYHSLYRQARKDWVVVPYEELIQWCADREGLAIGDFGCGEALLAEAVSDRHTVHSFDHVAINHRVTACNMADVPIESRSLDAAIFSLSLMGADVTEYVLEAHRTLKLDGHLHIFEATSRISDRDGFLNVLRQLGFDVRRVEDKWKFTHFWLVKNERLPTSGVELRFS